MPTLSLLLHGKRHDLAFEPGLSLRDFLDATEYRVRSACQGMGACGLCRLRLLAGDGGEITAAEHLQLGAGIADGLRLACQCRPQGDVTVELLNLAAPSPWHAPPPGLVSAMPVLAADRPLPAGISHPLGVAVDLGTSHLTLAVCDLASGRTLSLRFGRNPQGRYGADVVTRIVAAENPAMARQLAATAREAIGAALADIAAREGLDLGRVGRVAVVGNTAMLALLADRNHGLLLRPDHWARPVDCAPTDGAAWTRDWGVAAAAEVEAVAPLAGFVGSDLLAGVAACGLTAGAAPALFVDFGTNSEIALWSGAELWVTAAAGGPAFEVGAGRSGMPAEAGAIHRVVFDDAGRPSCAILGDDRARGICGSGLVDLVAGLRRAGILTAVGKFADGRAHYDLPADGQALALDWRDVDALQRAKAAIGAGIAVLCAEAGIAIGELRRVVAAGLFGRYLDVANACSIGLLPNVPAERIELAGNTALAGAVAMLSSRSAQAEVERARTTARFVNLARMPGFDAAFLDHLYLQPMAS
jgi:uncharacterized 2Fe-2S/4Fe-4S cluster protein (DUF4445 family)